MANERFGVSRTVPYAPAEVFRVPFEQDREIAWTVLGVIRPTIGHIYGYRLEPVETEDGPATKVISYYDWSDIHPQWRAKNIFPILSETALKATLGILERTLRAQG